MPLLQPAAVTPSAFAPSYLCTPHTHAAPTIHTHTCCFVRRSTKGMTCLCSAPTASRPASASRLPARLYLAAASALPKRAVNARSSVVGFSNRQENDVSMMSDA